MCGYIYSQTYSDWHLPRLTMGATALFYAVTKVIMEEWFAHMFTHSFIFFTPTLVTRTVINISGDGDSYLSQVY